MPLRLTRLLAALTLLAAIGASAELEVAKKGAKLGQWTHDFAAAREVAAKNKVPLLLNFTGSDWCGWCDVVDKRVLSQAKFQEYANENLVLVYLDFPQDESLVPEPFRERNRKLQQQYGVQGFPTFVLLDDDGETKLGSFGGGGREATPESFLGDIRKALKNRPEAIAAFIEALPAADAKLYREHREVLEKDQKALAEWLATNPDRSAENMAKFQTFNTKIQASQTAIQKIEIAHRARKLGGDQGEELQATFKKFLKTRDELEDWLASGPEQNEENMKRYRGFMAQLQELQAKIDQFQE